jgi:hypothetical protein
MAHPLDSTGDLGALDGSPSVAIRLASLEGTVRGWADLTEHRLGGVERDLRAVREHVDQLRTEDAQRTGRAGLLIALASVGTGAVTIFGGPLVDALLR